MERGKGWRAPAALKGLDAALGMDLIKHRTEGSEIRGCSSPQGPQGRKTPFNV